MKIAVSSTGTELGSKVEQRFGRAPYFVVVDTETGETVAVDNSGAAGALKGAGIQAAQSVVDHGAKALLTGHCGPNAFQVLQAAGVQVANGASGTVKEAVDAFLNGKLPVTDKADVKGQW